MKKMKKYNIAFFTSASSGLAHYVTHLYKSMKNYSKPYYVTYNDVIVDSFVRENIKDVYQLIKNNSAFSISSTIKFLKDKKIDFINIHIGTTARKYYLHYIALICKAKLEGIKVIGTIHDVMPFESFYIDPAAVELMYSIFDHYIVGNQTEADKLQLYFKIASDKITIIKHGPYVLFDNHKFDQNSSRKLLGIDKDKKVILFFGQLKPHKGLKYLIKAFKGIDKKVKDSMLYISTDLTYSPQLNEYLVRIEKSGAAKDIRLVKEYVSSDKIEPIFKAADLVALPYTQSSQSGVLNLAYAFKKPVVVTDVFDEAKFIGGVSGEVAKAEDVESLEKSIVNLLNLPSKELKEKGIKGYDFAEKYNSWDKAAMEISKIMDKLKNEK